MTELSEIHILIVDPSKERNSSLRSILQAQGITKIVESAHYKLVEEKLKKEKFNYIFIGEDFLDSGPSEALHFFATIANARKASIWLHGNVQNDEELNMLKSIGLEGKISYPTDEKDVKCVFERFLKSVKKQKDLKDFPDLIRNSKFFEFLSNDDFSLLLKQAHPLVVEAEEKLLLKGNTTEVFLVLLKGSAEEIYSSDEHSFSLPLQPGSVVGLNAVLNQEDQESTVYAKTHSKWLSISSKVITDKNSPLRLKLLAKACEKLTVVCQRLVGISEKLLSSTEEGLSLERQDKHSEINQENRLDLEGEITEEDEDDTPPNPFAVPSGFAKEVDDSVKSQDEYDVLHRKINLRADFIVNKIPNALQDIVRNKLYGYWTGGKLAKVNPHNLWSVKSFTPGTPTLKRALHLVVLCSKGEDAYKKAFLDLPFSHRAVGLPQIGCAGTFLSSEESISRYFENEPLEKAIQLDFEIPIDRIFYGKDCIEYLTHTAADVRPETLFLVFDETDGVNTQVVRKYFPMHQVITVIKDTSFDREDLSTIFTQPEEELEEMGVLTSKKEYKSEGFYTGQTIFLPDFSMFYKKSQLAEIGYVFGTIGMLSLVGPDYSGMIWGSKGGAEGAVKASRAMFGTKGAQTAADLARAIQWADE